MTITYEYIAMKDTVFSEFTKHFCLIYKCLEDNYTTISI